MTVAFGSLYDAFARIDTAKSEAKTAHLGVNRFCYVEENENFLPALKTTRKKRSG